MSAQWFYPRAKYQTKSWRDIISEKIRLTPFLKIYATKTGRKQPNAQAELCLASWQWVTFIFQIFHFFCSRISFSLSSFFYDEQKPPVLLFFKRQCFSALEPMATPHWQVGTEVGAKPSYCSVIHPWGRSGWGGAGCIPFVESWKDLSGKAVKGSAALPWCVLGALLKNWEVT